MRRIEAHMRPEICRFNCALSELTVAQPGGNRYFYAFPDLPNEIKRQHSRNPQPTTIPPAFKKGRRCLEKSIDELE